MTDPCVFHLIWEGKVVLILTVHVDDMAVGGTGVEVDKLLVTRDTDFTTNNLRELSFFTGYCIIQDTENGVLKLNQKKFCLLYTSPSPRDLSTSRMPSSA